jgi:hypothetical protein
MDIEYLDTGATYRATRCRQGANMCDQDHFENDRQEYESRGLVTRKQFGKILGAGIAMMLPRVANAVTVAESDVSITTPDGTADCYFVHPASGTAPGVLFWPDIFGLRPALRQMAKRLAESGYSVLVVNPFYRTKKAPTADAGAATPIQQVLPLAQSLNETTHMTDAKAFIGWLDKQPPWQKIARSAHRVIAWAVRWRFVPRPPCPIASEQSPHSMAGTDWRQTCRTAHICRRRGARRNSSSQSLQMTTCRRPMKRTF